MNTARSVNDSDEGDMTERGRHEEAIELGETLRKQIEYRMREANNKRRNDLEEGRNFLEQINWDSRRMMKLMQSEKSKVTNELKMAWDRDTHVKNVLKLRRKMLKKGRSSFLISFLKNPSLLNILSQSIPPTLFI
jgi:hypothetical protein